MYDVLLTAGRVNLERRVDVVGEEIKAKLFDEFHEIEQRIINAKNITVNTERGTTEIEGRTHCQFSTLLAMVATRHPILMVGTAGSGKTFAAAQVAEALTLPFYAISVGAQTSKSDLVGYMNATGKYVKTTFRDAYERGGVFLMDEIDAGNPNVLIVLNSALSSDVCAFPDKMVKRHKDFYFIATANTFGTGATRQYVGRNQLDAATLDRFMTIEWQVDEALEGALVEGFEHGPPWHAVVKAARARVAKEGYRIIVSPRATQKGAALLDIVPLKEVVDMVLVAGATEEQRQVIHDVVKQVWRRETA